LKNKIIKNFTLISMSSLVMATSAYSEKIGGLILNTDLYSSEPTDLVGKTIKTQHNTKKVVHSVVNTKPKWKIITQYKSNIIKWNQNYNLIEILHNLEISEKLIWKIEYNHFLEYFNLNNSTPEEIQSKINEFASDWKLWPKALEKIYKKVYSKNLNKCSDTIKRRWKMYLEILQYPKKYSRWIKPDDKILNIFDHMTFFWRDIWYNKEWTNINENLIEHYWKTIDYKNPLIIVEKYRWKIAVVVYDKWELIIWTYTTPWRLTNKSPQNKTKMLRFNEKKEWHWKLDKYHTSWNSKRNGAKMFNWIFIDWMWIYFHATNHKIDWKPWSWGCFRLPWEASDILYNYLKSLYWKKVKVKLGKIY